MVCINFCLSVRKGVAVLPKKLPAALGDLSAAINNMKLAENFNQQRFAADIVLFCPCAAGT